MMLRYHLPPIVWGAAIFFSSSIPSAHLPQLPVLGADKLVHIVLYAILAWLLHRSFRTQRLFPRLRSNSLITAVVLSAAYGITDELHQFFVPGRSASILDGLADFVGASLYSLVARVRATR